MEPQGCGWGFEELWAGPQVRLWETVQAAWTVEGKSWLVGATHALSAPAWASGHLGLSCMAFLGHIFIGNREE